MSILNEDRPFEQKEFPSFQGSVQTPSRHMSSPICSMDDGLLSRARLLVAPPSDSFEELWCRVFNAFDKFMGFYATRKAAIEKMRKMFEGATWSDTSSLKEGL